MKNFFSLFLLLCAVFCSRLAAAQGIPGRPLDRCATTEVTNAYLAAHPELKDRMAAVEAHTQRYLRNNASLGAKEAPGPQRPLLIIPVVVHVVARTGPKT